MSKQHQASRRRTYGRRQHELHERSERPIGRLGWLAALQIDEAGALSGIDRLARADSGPQLIAQGID